MIVRPYEKLEDLPEAVKKLPKEAQEIWLAAFNAAYDEYDGDEQKAFAVAWAAVKKAGYKTGDDDEPDRTVQNMFVRMTRVEHVLDVNPQKMRITAVLATQARCADGLALDVRGCQVMGDDGVPLLWAHGDSSFRGSLPIGSVRDIRIERVKVRDYDGDALVGDKYYYAPADELADSELARLPAIIWDMRRQGHFRAVSIGFEILEMIPPDERGINVRSWRLYEVSDCAIGADPYALDRALSGLTARQMKILGVSGVAASVPGSAGVRSVWELMLAAGEKYLADRHSKGGVECRT